MRENFHSREGETDREHMRMYMCGLEFSVVDVRRVIVTYRRVSSQRSTIDCISN